MIDMYSDEINCDTLASGFDPVELLMSVNTFAGKLHFFDDIVKFVKPELTKTGQVSISVKIEVETQVLKMFQILFNIEFNKNSSFKQYSRSAIEVYGFI